MSDLRPQCALPKHTTSLEGRLRAWVTAPEPPQRLRSQTHFLRDAHGAKWCAHFRTLLIAGDSVAVAVAVALTYLVRFGAAGGGPSIAGAWEALIVAVVWLLSLSMVGSRDRRVLSAGIDEYKRVMAGSLYAFGAVAIGSYLLKAELSRFYFVMTLPLGVFLLLTVRWLARVWLSDSRRRGKYMVPTIVIGTQDRVDRVAHELRLRRDFGLSPSAACVVGSSKRNLSATARLPEVAMTQLPGMIADGSYGSVVVAGGLSSEQLRDLTWKLERSGVDVILYSDVVEATGPRLTFQEVAGLDLVHVEFPRFSGWPLRVKRVFDIVFSALALTLLSPILLAIAIAIYLDDPGPIIFRQQRIGLNGTTFTIHKFRSMAVDAEARLESLLSQSMGNGPLFKMDEDPRVTRVGQVLRKYSLDELPQFWTVIRGNMSVVGPRPHLEKELDEFPDEGLRRLLIKPGITGLWQVNGRSDLSLEDSIKLDLRYVQTWSFLGDLVIILKTVKAMLSPGGAY